jgi:hypothetical protein
MYTQNKVMAFYGRETTRGTFIYNHVIGKEKRTD